MKTKQTVAIIGADGSIGAAIALGLADGNYRLLLCAQDLQATAELAAGIRAIHPEADLEPVACATEAAWEADIIMLAAGDAELAGRIRNVSNQKILVQLQSAPGAASLQEQLPHIRVVTVCGLPAAVTLAGQDAAARAEVATLLGAAGFRSADAAAASQTTNAIIITTP